MHQLCWKSLLTSLMLEIDNNLMQISLNNFFIYSNLFLGLLQLMHCSQDHDVRYKLELFGCTRHLFNSAHPTPTPISLPI